MIFLKPRGGLCNRLRAISSALALARERNGSLTVYWCKDPGMDVKFSSFAKTPVEFEIVEFSEKGETEIARKFKPDNKRYANNVNNINFENFDILKEKILSSPKDEDWAIETCSQFHSNLDFSWFRPLDSINTKIAVTRKMLGDEYIGIHIRRTDNFKGRLYSPLYLFENAIKAEIANNPSVKFYLASDDEFAKASLTAKFGSRIFTRNNISARFDANGGGLEDAVIDLKLLSMCKKLYGSYWSSFSEVAAEIGRVEFIQLKEFDLDKSMSYLQVECTHEDMFYRNEKNLLKSEIAELKASFAYRVGMFVTWPARKFYRLIKGKNG